MHALALATGSATLLPTPTWPPWRGPAGDAAAALCSASHARGWRGRGKQTGPDAHTRGATAGSWWRCRARRRSTRRRLHSGDGGEILKQAQQHDTWRTAHRPGSAPPSCPTHRRWAAAACQQRTRCGRCHRSRKLWHPSSARISPPPHAAHRTAALLPARRYRLPPPPCSQPASRLWRRSARARPARLARRCRLAGVQGGAGCCEAGQVI